MDFTKSPWKEIAEAGQLFVFFLVSGPTVYGGDYYHDINDEPINCNIYHPKYGYPGHVADTYQSTLTSYSSSISYEDPRTRKRVWCKYYLEVLCQHPDGTFTNKDGEQVIIVPQFITRPQLATIGNIDEYKEIYNREFSKEHDLPESMREDNSFKKVLHKQVQKLIDLHIEKSAPNTLDKRLLILADKFQEYLIPIDGFKKKDPADGYNVITVDSPDALPTWLGRQADALQLNHNQRHELLTEYELKSSCLNDYKHNGIDNFHKIPLVKIKAYFMQLVHKEYLDEGQINSFMNRAFCGNKEVGLQTAKIGELDTMGALFYLFYDRCIHLGVAKQRGHQPIYVALLTENFTNYANLKKSLPSNFSKFSSRKNAWKDPSHYF